MLIKGHIYLDPLELCRHYGLPLTKILAMQLVMIAFNLLQTPIPLTDILYNYIYIYIIFCIVNDLTLHCKSATFFVNLEQIKNAEVRAESIVLILITFFILVTIYNQCSLD